MQVKAILEKEDGAFEFTAEVSAEQHAWLMEFAIKTLFVNGMLPIAQGEGDGPSLVDVDFSEQTKQ